MKPNLFTKDLDSFLKENSKQAPSPFPGHFGLVQRRLQLAQMKRKIRSNIFLGLAAAAGISCLILFHHHQQKKDLDIAVADILVEFALGERGGHIFANQVPGLSAEADDQM